MKYFLLFVMIFSCQKISENEGKISLHATGEKDSFVFMVSEKFLEENNDSPTIKSFQNITKAELKLLERLLKTKNYCLKKGRKPKFMIDSRQEKIYDATYSHLINLNYNIRPLTPVSYYGHCINNS